MNQIRSEWKQLKEALAAKEKDNSDQQEVYYEEQREMSDQVRTLLLKIILEEELIPKTGWSLEDSRDRNRLCIHHDLYSDDKIWQPALQVWDDSSWHHMGLRLEGDGIDVEVTLRIDDELMSMNFQPPSKLAEFAKSYGLQVSTDGIIKKRAELAKSVEALDEILKLLEI